MTWRLKDPGDKLLCSGITPAIIAASAISGGASIANGIMGSNAATSAAQTQAAAAAEGANIVNQTENNIVGEAGQMFDTQQQTMSPFIQSGQNALTQINSLMGPGGSLTQGYQQFDPSQVQFDPGFNYRLNLANQAVQAWGAKTGTFMSGGTGMQLEQNSQNMASQEYQNAYSRALNTYNTNANTFYQNQANQFNRLATQAGAGQSAATSLSGLGSQYINAITGSQQNAATQTANLLTGGAAATAAGQVGSANAWTNSLTGASNNFTQLALLSQLLNNGANGGTPAATTPGAGAFSTLATNPTSVLNTLQPNPLPGQLNPSYAG